MTVTEGESIVEGGRFKGKFSTLLRGRDPLSGMGLEAISEGVQLSSFNDDFQSFKQKSRLQILSPISPSFEIQIWAPNFAFQVSIFLFFHQT